MKAAVYKAKKSDDPAEVFSILAELCQLNEFDSFVFVFSI